MTSEEIRPALDASMSAQSENRHQQQLVFNPDRECNSLAEYIVVLRHCKVPDHIVSDLTALIRKLAESNARELGLERDATRVLDRAVANLHGGRQPGGNRSVLTVKSAAQRLRPHLKVLAGPKPIDGAASSEAHRAIRDVLRVLPDAVVRGRGLRHELGKGPHDTLLGLLAVEVAA
jgi:hypothetical protein